MKTCLHVQTLRSRVQTGGEVKEVILLETLELGHETLLETQYEEDSRGRQELDLTMKWFLSRPRCLVVHSGLSLLSHLSFTSSSQRKETMKTTPCTHMISDSFTRKQAELSSLQRLEAGDHQVNIFRLLSETLV